MKAPQGKLIVIEGTDGSGKATQTNLLVKRLLEKEYRVATASFPQYGKKSAGLVEEYLNGKYGEPNLLDPKIASLFYALDRFDISSEIRARLEEGNIMILDRYVDSNAGHQGGKIKDARERARFFAWLYDIEFNILKIPKPDLVLILHVPATVGQQLVAEKQQRLYIEDGKKADKHESNLEHLKNAEAAYLWLAKHAPKNHIVISCVEQGKILPPDAIHKKIWAVIKPVLQKKYQ